MAPPLKRKRPIKKAKTRCTGKSFWLLLSLFLFFVVAIGLFKFRDGLLYYLGFTTDNAVELSAEERKLADIRIYEVLHKHDEKAIGFDVSEYKSTINWEETYSIDESFELSFVFIRATAGINKLDRRFKDNWKGAEDRQLIRGAYHYYRPNENSLEQAELFIKTVRLQKGDLPPVLDIEKLPKNQSMTNLKKGLRRWLQAIENHYKVKPIIYTGEKYYDDFLKEEFSDYLFWIANYNFYREEIQDDWLFWQFTERAAVPGIEGNVDVNIYNGDLQQLQFITIE